MKGRITAAGLGPRSQDLFDSAGTALPGGIPHPIDFHLPDDRRRLEVALARTFGRERQFS